MAAGYGSLPTPSGAPGGQTGATRTEGEMVREAEDSVRVEAVDSFPRQAARTRRFTLGHPRSFAVARDGSRVAFLRSRAGDDPSTSLWAVDLPGGGERLVADPGSVAAGAEELTFEERARRERAREMAEGIVQFAADPDLRSAVFTIGGELYSVDLTAGKPRRIAATSPAFDPRLDPTGRRVAYVSGNALRVVDLSPDVSGTSGDRLLVHEDDPDVSWGLAEFVAAEDMERSRGHWWSPDGELLVAARVDTSPVVRWHISDPAAPQTPPTVVAYPAAGTPNADVTLHLVRLDGTTTEIPWDRSAFEYLVAVAWGDAGPLTVLVQSRDQKRWTVLEGDPKTGDTRSLWEDTDEAWLHIVPGVPAWSRDGRLLMTADREDTRRLLANGTPVTPAGLNVNRVIDVGAEIVSQASH